MRFVSIASWLIGLALLATQRPVWAQGFPGDEDLIAEELSKRYQLIGENRRDLFTFRAKKQMGPVFDPPPIGVSAITIPGKGPRTTGNQTKHPGLNQGTPGTGRRGTVDHVERERMRRMELRDKLHRGREQALWGLGEGKFERVIRICEEVLGKIESDPAMIPILPEIEEKVLRIRRAAVRLRRRRIAESDFHKRSPRVNGIIWSARDPLAIIDGQTSHEGDSIADHGATGPIGRADTIRVHRIEKDFVVFLFRGYKIRTALPSQP